MQGPSRRVGCLGGRPTGNLISSTPSVFSPPLYFLIFSFCCLFFYDYFLIFSKKVRISKAQPTLPPQAEPCPPGLPHFRVWPVAANYFVPEMVSNGQLYLFIIFVNLKTAKKILKIWILINSHLTPHMTQALPSYN